MLFGLMSGLWAGLLFGLANEFTTMFGENADAPGAVEPKALFRADRNRWLATGLTVGLTLAFALRISGDLLTAVRGVLPVTYRDGLVGGLTVGLAGGIAIRAWGWLGVARVWLAVTGRMPWHVMAFLAHAHDLEALRQAGGVYQFRHALLRDRLARRPR